MRLSASRPSVVFSALALALAAGVFLYGCDKDSVVKPEERLLAVGNDKLSICPDPSAVNQVGTSVFTATVFARDGQVAIGVPVTFSSSVAGTLTPATASTDNTGKATTTLSAVRPAGNQVFVTATLDNGLSATSRTVGFPIIPRITLPGSSTAPTVGTEFTTTFSVFNACNISGLVASLTYDAAVIEYVPGKEIQGNILNDLSSDATPVPTNVTLTVNAVPGAIDVSYTRNDTKSISADGNYLALTFKAIKAGDARIRFTSARLNAGVPPHYTLTPFYEPGVVPPAGSAAAPSITVP